MLRTLECTVSVGGNSTPALGLGYRVQNLGFRVQGLGFRGFLGPLRISDTPSAQTPEPEKHKVTPTHALLWASRLLLPGKWEISVCNKPVPWLRLPPYPKGPCRNMGYTWALK